MSYKESLNDFINSQNWIFAKTMADIPHWYCLKSKCDDKGSWDWFVRFMDEYGIEGSFYDYSGINVPFVAVCNVPPVAQCNVPPQKWLQ
jgi:hypothetical protein